MADEKPRADNDSPWKEILEAYFPLAIEFFFPQTAALIDWSKPHEFLDKEFQQIAKEGEIGRRYADKLVKVWLLGGEEIWLLIHVEVQATSEAAFAERMFSYNLRIFDRFKKPAISLAILCDTNHDWRPNQYSYDYPNTRLSFEFGIVKLLDYEKKWAELETSDNPFATVVMAHLKTQQTAKKPQDRKRWKFSLIRRLYELGWQEKDIRNLYRFIDWVMILPRQLETEFWQELKQFEQESRMSYMTTGERIGYERGKEEGQAEGQAQGQAQGQKLLILKLLRKRLGELPQQVNSQIESLTLEQLDTLGEVLLDFTSTADLRNWLEANPPESSNNL